jgi:hypothetical protein
MILLLCAILFTVGAGLVAFSSRPNFSRTGFILEFVAALIYTLTLVLPLTGN